MIFFLSTDQASKERLARRQELLNSGTKVVGHLVLMVKQETQEEPMEAKQQGEKRGDNSNAKPYKCANCDRSYVYKGDLTRHVNQSCSPTKGPGFMCEYCHKVFPHKFVLNRHKLKSCSELKEDSGHHVRDTQRRHEATLLCLS